MGVLPGRVEPPRDGGSIRTTDTRKGRVYQVYGQDPGKSRKIYLGTRADMESAVELLAQYNSSVAPLRLAMKKPLKVPPERRREQAVEFVFNTLAADHPGLTRAMVAEALDSMLRQL